MRKSNLFILAAWALHVTSWFLPAAKAPDFSVIVPGWKAFRLAACGVLPCEGIEFQGMIYAVLATISVITTLFFILYSPWVVLRGTRTVQKSSAWFAGAAFVFNAHWIVIFRAQGALLMIGFFLWWLSFLLLAIGLFRLPEIKTRELLPSRA
jgi:hypothetical protein